MSIRSIRKCPLTPEEELENQWDLAEIRERIRNIKPEVSGGDDDMYSVPERSYWPYIKAALDAGDDEFDKVIDSLFDGTFEFPPETPEEYEARMKQRRKVCFKY